MTKRDPQPLVSRVVVGASGFAPSQVICTVEGLGLTRMNYPQAPTMVDAVSRHIAKGMP